MSGSSVTRVTSLSKMKSNSIALLLSWVVLTGTPLRAAEMRPLAIEKLRDKAHAIVHGTVSGKTVQRDAAGRIYTKIDFELIESWKGKIDGAHFTLVHAGGVLGEESSAAFGQEEFAVGEEVVTFLVLNERGEGVTVGLSQGKFHVAQDPVTREKSVHNFFHGCPPDRAGTDGGNGHKKARLSLLELKQQVQKGSR